MTDSIRVCCRFRRDKEGEELDEWEFDKDTNLVKLRDKKFNYDEVLDMNTSQEEMYEKVAARTIEDFTNGYHGTLFAYGNSGSGKTFSIVGPDEIVEFLCKDFSTVPEDIQNMYGVIPRATIAIFNAINGYTSSGATCSLSATYIEIYNETITCLLNGKENLKIHEIPKVGFAISGKEERPCMCPEDIFKVLYIGTKNKTVGGTLQNARSSRSHTLLSLNLCIKTIDGSERNSKLNIVDLAGSEKLKNTGASTPERIKEAQKINLSLTTLGMCIMALTENASFVPFRNSKLTLLLKESLGGNSKTTLLCAARRDKKLVEDNLNSLYFAQRAKQIKTKCVKNVKLSDKENAYIITALKNEIVQLRKQVKELGQVYKPITDTKLLQLIEGDFGESVDGAETIITDNTSVSTTNTTLVGGSNARNKRLSLINLSEDEIILKYCELRAKYDNLLENAGNKILELNSNQNSSSGTSIPAEQLQEVNKKYEEDLANQKAEYEAEIKRLEEKINFSLREKSKLEEDLEAAKEDYNGLQEMLDLNTLDIEAMTNQVDDKEKEIDILLKDKEDLETQVQNKNVELQSRDLFIEDLKKQISELNQKFSETDNNLNSQVGLVKEKDLQIESLLQEIKNYRDSESELKKQLQTANESKNKSETASTDLKSKIAELENQILSKDSTITYLNSSLDNLKNIEKQKFSDQDVFAEKDKLFNETKSILEERITQLIEQSNQNNKSFNEEKTKLQSEMDEMKNLIDTMKKDNNDLSFEVKSKTAELNNVKELRDSSLSTKDNELQIKINELNDAKYKILENEKEFNSKLLKYEEQIYAKKTTIVMLEGRISSLTKENEKFVKTKEEEIAKLTKDKNTLTKENESLKTYIEKLEIDVANLEAKIKELRDRIDFLETTNKELIEVSYYIYIFLNRNLLVYKSQLKTQDLYKDKDPALLILKLKLKKQFLVYIFSKKLIISS